MKRRTGRYIAANILDWVTIAASIGALGWELVVGFGTKQLPFLITLFVAIIATSTVAQYLTRADTSRTVKIGFDSVRDQIEHVASSQMSVEPPLRPEMFHGAREIWLMGISLDRTLRDHWPALRTAVMSGTNLKIVIVNYTSDHIKYEYFERYLFEHDDAKRERLFASRFDEVQASIDQIRRRLPATAGGVTIALSPFFPACGVTLIDPEEPRAHGYFEIYLSRDDGNQPHYLLDSSSGVILDMMKEEFRMMAAPPRERPETLTRGSV